MSNNNEPKVETCKHCGRKITLNTAISPIGGKVWPYMHIDGTVVCQVATYAEPWVSRNER